AKCSQQFPPSDGDCHAPLPREVRKGKDTTPRARCPNCVAPGAGGGRAGYTLRRSANGGQNAGTNLRLELQQATTPRCAKDVWRQTSYAPHPRTKKPYAISSRG